MVLVKILSIGFKILLNNQESCMTNGGHTTKYLRIEGGTWQVDPNSACIFILALEIRFIFINFNQNIDGINIFDHEYLYTAYADDTMFFLKNQTSVKNVLNDIETLPNISGLRFNLNKCEIAGIGVLKNVNVALCGMKNINQNKESIKMLGVYISHNRKIKMNWTLLKLSETSAIL